jgi:hypothetical protein
MNLLTTDVTDGWGFLLWMVLRGRSGSFGGPEHYVTECTDGTRCEEYMWALGVYMLYMVKTEQSIVPELVGRPLWIR